MINNLRYAKDTTLIAENANEKQVVVMIAKYYDTHIMLQEQSRLQLWQDIDVVSK